MRFIERHRGQRFTRRAFFMMGLQAAATSALGLRLYHLQRNEGEHYRQLAENNRINFRLVEPLRGRILDHKGIALAENQDSFNLQLVPEEAAEAGVEVVLRRIASIVRLGETNIKKLLRETRRHPPFVPIMVREFLTYEEMARVSLWLYDLPGTRIGEGHMRHYPAGPVSSHITGFVGRAGPEEIGDDPLLKLPGMRIGKQGIEHRYESRLRGEAGHSRQEVNAHGRVVKVIDKRSEQHGETIALHLDQELQTLAYQLLQEKRAGAAVVLNVKDGAIRALASVPAYDPNLFVDGISEKNWRALIDNPLGPMTNKAVSGLYAPGSTFKMATMLAALEAGISPRRQFFCRGYVELGDHRFHCWKEKGHRFVSAKSAMAQSCDTWFYNIAQEVGIDAIADAARRLGLGTQTGIDLGSESSGVVPDRAWKRQTLDESWFGGETLINAIGQGFVLATPLQLAKMTACIANGGQPIQPRLLKTEKDSGISDNAEEPDKPDKPSDWINPDHLAFLREAMMEVVENPRGTAHSRLYNPNRPTIAGKTGTSQVRRISIQEREEGIRKGEDIAWKLRDHALFVGFAPAENPRYAVSVLVEHGGSGSSTAAPIARDLLWRALDLDQGDKISRPV